MTKTFASGLRYLFCLLIVSVNASSQSPERNPNPEPPGWYAGDMHVHRNCGDDSIVSVKELAGMMEENDLSVISLLADMGNAEVKDSKTDLLKVNGRPAAESTPNRIINWDVEWHWDATYSHFEKQALGGHLVLLGLNKASQIWEESPYKVLDWAKKQGAVSGFAHMQYLNDSIQQNLNCCIPIDYPVEAAMGTIDFISEDVFARGSPNNGNYFSDGTINAYYRLLNCGFRISLVAGTDFPCNNREPLGNLLTYVSIPDAQISYTEWVQGIKKGRTVVSRNAHNEFLDLKVNGTKAPGDIISLNSRQDLGITVKWTTSKPERGWVELVKNGRVIARTEGTAKPGEPVVLSATQPFSESGWICARRMSDDGHVVHTSPVYVEVNEKPVRVNREDAEYFISWINNILQNIEPGGEWNKYFPNDYASVKKRYLTARSIYEKIKAETDSTIGGRAKIRFQENMHKVALENKVPLLVLGDETKFGLYTSEILRAEGFNAFHADSLNRADISEAFLKNYDIVILGESKLTPDQQRKLTAYVREGGNLIAFKPHKQMADVFGIIPQKGMISDGYISIDDQTEIGKGLISQPLQIHGAADKYSLKKGRSLATFFKDIKTSLGLPAVVLNSYGKGIACAFLYNLPQNIVLTRQGNYKNTGKEMDGITGIRAMDLFTDGWVNTSANTINQADEQMRLLSHCIENMSRRTKPLPRFWYFPDTLKCLVTLNNDGEDSEENEFTPQFEDVDAKGAKMTLYIKETDKVSSDWVDRWIKKGFEISGHPDNTKQAEAPDWNTMDSVIRDLTKKLKNKYGITGMNTCTNHWFVWCGYNRDGTPNFAAQARIEENNGIELDCNYAHYDNNSSQGHFLGEMGTKQGNYTGSGLAMKFADNTGKLINVYQQLNNVYDQQYMENKDQDGYYHAFKGLMDRSLEDEVYSYISVRAHNNEYFFSKVPLMKMLDYANSKKIPVWTEASLLEFLKAKDDAAFKNITWKNNRLGFTITSSEIHKNNICFMIPVSYKGKKINALYINGEKQLIIVRNVKGYEYAIAVFKPGTNYKVDAAYGN